MSVSVNRNASLKMALLHDFFTVEYSVHTDKQEGRSQTPCSFRRQSGWFSKASTLDWPNALISTSKSEVPDNLHGIISLARWISIRIWYLHVHTSHGGAHIG
jgi:hypothetical protein